MSITTVPSVVTGQTYSAANYNTQVRDNINGIWVLTTAGDMLYATGASAANRLALVVGGVMYGGASAPAWLAKPASLDSLLKNTSAGVLSWLAINGIPGILHTSGFVASNTARNTNSTTLTDVVGMSFDLTLTQTCTVIAMCFGISHTDDGLYQPVLAINIDGNDDPNLQTAQRDSDNLPGYPFIALHRRTGVTAGTRTVKLRFYIANASDAVYFVTGKMIALAFAE